tara:strand:+ start:2936 stop:3202 length:267 start_codon:yes stop_codon:yes gene_type:complete
MNISPTLNKHSDDSGQSERGYAQQYLDLAFKVSNSRNHVRPMVVQKAIHSVNVALFHQMGFLANKNPKAKALNRSMPTQPPAAASFSA